MDTSGRSFEFVVQPGNTIVGDVSTAALLKLPAYLSGVRFIAETIAPLRKRVLDADKNEHREHSAYRLLNTRPSRQAGPTITHQTQLTHATTYGNGYCRVRRSPRGAAQWYENVEPSQIKPFAVDGVKWFYLVDTKEVLPNEDVAHLMGVTHNGIIGIRPTDLLCDMFETARVLQRYQLKYFKNGTFINGVIETPVGTTVEQFETMATAWARKHNIEEAGKPGWLVPGAKWTSTTADNQQSQLPTLRAASDTDIARVLRIHPSIIYANANGTLAGLEPSIIKTSLRTWIEQLEDEYTLKLLTPEEVDAGWHVRIDTNEIMRGDPKWLATMSAGVNAGVVLPNECREAFDLPPVAGGDVLRMPVNVAQPSDAAGTDDADKPDEPASQDDKPKDDQQ